MEGENKSPRKRGTKYVIQCEGREGINTAVFNLQLQIPLW